MIILPIEWVKNTVENVVWIFLKMTDQLYLIKYVLIMHNKCSQADIAHNYDNCSHNEQRTLTNKHIETTDGWMQASNPTFVLIDLFYHN